MSVLKYVAAGLAVASAIGVAIRVILHRRRQRAMERELALSSSADADGAAVEAWWYADLEVEDQPIAAESADILYEDWPQRRLDPSEVTWDPAPSRFANVAMRSPGGGRSVVVGEDSHAVITVDIGRIRFESDVVDPMPFPDDLLPQEDLTINVLLSCAALPVGLRVPGDEGKGSRAVEQMLVLPKGGGPSESADGTGALRFALGLPHDCRKTRARLSYFYRDTIVQSQRLDLVSDPTEERSMKLEVATDFTLSARLGASVNEIVDRPRVSFLVNANSPEEHGVTVRSPGNAVEPVAFRIPSKAASTVLGELRKELQRRSPKRRARSSADLAEDLKRLAPLAHELFHMVSGEARYLIRTAPADAVIQVTMPKESGFTLPWNLLYDIPLDSEANLAVCPVVEALGSGTLPIDPDTRECPHPDHPEHAENLLCPFGFWGMRKTIEVLPPRQEPGLKIELAEDAQILLGQTNRGVNQKRLATHMKGMADSFQRRSSDITVKRAETKEDVRKGLSVDLPFAYFLCHGERPGRARSTQLRVGKGEKITPSDFENWAERVRMETEHRLWTKPQPLIFVNACDSLAIAPEDLVGYLGAFVEEAQAVGLIGTETRVDSNLAMEVGQQFFDSLLHDDATVDDALRKIKAGYLQNCNLFGLFYTPYCFADVQVDPPSRPPSPAG